MNKGINTTIEETKNELLNWVNQKLQNGLPISVMGLIIDNMGDQVKNEIVKSIKLEEIKHKEELEKAEEVVEE